MTLPPARAILYLEDNRILREMVREVLEFAGWYVKELDSSVYTLATLEVTQQHFDVLLFDYEIRGLDGLELTRRVRRIPHRKETPIIVLSITDVTAEARAAGANAFLRKPYNLIDLVETIRRLLPAPAGS